MVCYPFYSSFKQITTAIEVTSVLRNLEKFLLCVVEGGDYNIRTDQLILR
jgi:hypothetical protein